ncbi:D-glucuronyl C5-epimerase family protein [Conexibacter sp. SYSU D00693]|uniref:D-glucuronyl C5-epimerase family protein n=1 Tax=Conexibacter sp. SYSU D00693 TaxID=2812560 RepID=UPI00196A576B|nr:D-glucuronyl C5-epimerase family protein [Conexibacter sp. SYSU D00693]
MLAGLSGPASASPITVLERDGRAVTREDPYLPPASPVDVPAGALAPARAPHAGAVAAARKTVPGELRRLLDAQAIDQAHHDRWRTAFDDARRTWRRLRGARRTALGSVIRTTQDVAASGRLTASRAPALFLTLERNRAWWGGGPLLAAGRRVSFAGSRLVWQHYPGHGLQIQWLGTFGKANGLFQSTEHDPELRQLLDEAAPLAAQRAGGIAWEYLFPFDGGRPPWASAMAQGTAMQAYSRAAIRLREPRYFEVARSAMGIFRTAPPQGVRITTDAGAHYLIYSSLPKLRVLNAFVQALNGLLDFARLANDAEGRALFEQGERELRRALPRYDTGAWSMYSTSRESDLGYHTLVRDFLRGLCQRLTDVRDRQPAVPEAGTPDTGGVAPTGPRPEVPDPALYCDTATRFTGYLREKPELELRTTRLREAVTGKLRFSLSKVSTVSITVLRGGRVVEARTLRLGGGQRAIGLRPSKAGPLTVRLRAVDLAGNAGAVQRVVRVAPKR